MMFDKQTSVAQDKFDLDEKQLKLDEKRFTLAKEVHQHNLARRFDVLTTDKLRVQKFEQDFLEFRKSSREYVDLLDTYKIVLDESQTLITEKEDTNNTRLNKKQTLLAEKEALLKESKYVCNIYLDPVPSELRALDPYGHYFCVTCILAFGSDTQPDRMMTGDIAVAFFVDEYLVTPGILSIVVSLL
jgi:hypothetical protein